jgi:hypothetical protein
MVHALWGAARPDGTLTMDPIFVALSPLYAVCIAFAAFMASRSRREDVGSGDRDPVNVRFVPTRVRIP